MAKVNTIGASEKTYIRERVEQSNHLVKLNGWEGVASHVVDDEQNVEGTLVWFPSVKVSDLIK
jgi:hypothetical protein